MQPYVVRIFRKNGVHRQSLLFSASAYGKRKRNAFAERKIQRTRTRLAPRYKRKIPPPAFAAHGKSKRMCIVGDKRDTVKRCGHPIFQNSAAVIALCFGKRYAEISDPLGYNGIASKLQHKNADNYNDIRKKEPK